MTPRQLAALVAALLVGGLGRLVLRASPRVGVRLVRWAAGLRYQGDPARAALRAEELAALVDDRPGRLLKLLTGLGFALHALVVAGLRDAPGGLRRLGGGVVRFARRHRVGVATVMAWVWLLVVSSGGYVVGLVLQEGYGLDGFWVGVGVGAGMLIVAVAGALGLARVTGVRETAAVTRVVVNMLISSQIFIGWIVFDLFGVWTGLVVTSLIAVASTTLSDRVKRQEPAREPGRE